MLREWLDPEWLDPTMTILVGKRVTVSGLASKPEMNGRAGTAIAFDDGKGRYTVPSPQTYCIYTYI